MTKISARKINWGGVFLVLLLLQTLFLEYNRFLEREPMGKHKWRQCDTASFAWNFSESTYNLFAPQTNNLLWDGEGKVAAEFPLIYWVVGMLTRWLGNLPLVFRLVNLSLGFWGLWSLFQIKRRLWGEGSLAMLSTLLLFTSPLLVYYLYNFIPDVPSFALALVGWHQLLRHYEKGTPRTWYLAALSLGLAVLLKASTGIHLVIWLFLLSFEQLGWIQWGEKRKIFTLPVWQYWGALLLLVMAVLGWYSWASWYSTGWEQDHFSGLISTMSEQPAGDWLYVIGILFTNHFRAYLPSLLMLLMVVLLGLCFSSLGRRHKLLFTLCLLGTLGSLAYLYLFFSLLSIHDYYLIVTMLVPTALLLTSGKILQTRFPQVFQAPALRLALFGLLLFCNYETRSTLRHDYWYKDQDPLHQALYQPDFQSYLSEIGVTPDQKIISLPDPSPNITLYLMQRRGWSLEGTPLQMCEAMEHFLTNYGASHLIILDPALAEHPELEPFTRRKVGTYDNVQIFDLSNMSHR